MLLGQAPGFGQNKLARQNHRDALIFELDHVKTGDFYLVIDLPAKRIHLKAEGNILRTCPILNLWPASTTRTQAFCFARRIDPISIEPGNANLRLRGRLFPLDFSGRLIEGPRHRSRLYFTPDLVIQAAGISTDATPYIILSFADIKALGSALRPGNTAIFIPKAEH